MIKKTIVALAVAGGLLAAGSALGAAYAPGAMPSANSVWASAASTSPASGLMAGLSQGTLSASDQMALYKQLQSGQPQVLMVSGGQGNVGYRAVSAMPGQFTAMAPPGGAMMVNFGRGQVWLSLMTVVTTVLVWAVLLVLIQLLWRLSRKHK